MFDSLNLADFALVLGIFLSGGLVKGITGFGLPTVTLGLLALTRPLPEAMAMVLLQPDLGSALVFLFIGAGIMFVGGIRGRYLAVLAAVAV